MTQIFLKCPNPGKGSTPVTKTEKNIDINVNIVSILVHIIFCILKEFNCF